MNTTKRPPRLGTAAQQTGQVTPEGTTTGEGCDGQLTLGQNATATDGLVYVPVADAGRLSTLEELGRLLRDEGLARANHNGDSWWKSCADTAITYLASTGMEFTADSLRDLIPSPDHPARTGARFSAAMKAGLIRPTGYAISRSSTRHAGVLRTWVGCDSK